MRLISKMKGSIKKLDKVISKICSHNFVFGNLERMTFINSLAIANIKRNNIKITLNLRTAYRRT